MSQSRLMSVVFKALRAVLPTMMCNFKKRLLCLQSDCGVGSMQVAGEAIMKALTAAERNAPDAAASQPVLEGFTTAIGYPPSPHVSPSA